MKVLIASLAVVLSLALCSATARAAGGNDKGDKGNGGNAIGNVLGSQNQGGNSSDHSSNSDSDRKNSKPNSDSKTSNKDKGSMGRENFVDRKNNLGDGGFDKHRIGTLDEKKYADRKDNYWRYRHWGNEWWYWLPESHWSYWRDGRWNHYDANTYVEASPTAVDSGSSSSASGPYYEDQNGFYTLQGNRKVYDPQIRREASPPAGAPAAPQG
jgi:hypothetical protein